MSSPVAMSFCNVLVSSFWVASCRVVCIELPAPLLYDPSSIRMFEMPPSLKKMDMWSGERHLPGAENTIGNRRVCKHLPRVFVLFVDWYYFQRRAQNHPAAEDDAVRGTRGFSADNLASYGWTLVIW